MTNNKTELTEFQQQLTDAAFMWMEAEKYCDRVQGGDYADFYG